MQAEAGEQQFDVSPTRPSIVREIEKAKLEESQYYAPISELDLTGCEACTPSYRKLPADYPEATCTGREQAPPEMQAIIAEVLNERLISFVACDVRSDNVMKGRNSEVPVYFGDAGSAQVLSTLGAKRASCAVVALDSPPPPSPPARAPPRAPFRARLYGAGPIDCARLWPPATRLHPPEERVQGGQEVRALLQVLVGVALREEGWVRVRGVLMQEAGVRDVNHLVLVPMHDERGRPDFLHQLEVGEDVAPDGPPAQVRAQHSNAGRERAVQHDPPHPGFPGGQLRGGPGPQGLPV